MVYLTPCKRNCDMQLILSHEVTYIDLLVFALFGLLKQLSSLVSNKIKGQVKYCLIAEYYCIPLLTIGLNCPI